MPTDICRWLILLISLSTWISFTNSKEMRVVCYYTNWSVYRPGTAKFSPQNINPYLCTHLIYAFGGFTKENTLKPFDKYQDIEKGGYAKFTGLKTYNKNLKTMLAIGGWNEGSSRFSPMVASPERRKELVKNAVKFLRQNHFDGLDLDWEYPTFRDGGKTRDRDNYAQLVKELREEFERESEKTGRTRLLLTMAVPAGIEYINKGYDVPKLSKYLDWMNILSYDYHSSYEPSVNHHAPLLGLEEDSEYNYDADLNIDHTIKHYLELGADPSKLVLGIPTYGRAYTLFNPDANEIGSPSDGPGEMGEATREAGYLAYYEICESIKSDDWEVVQPDEEAMGPYAFKGNQWVGYDDEGISRKKAQYVAKNNLGGIMFWSIDNDDFRGSCHGRPYPLIEAAKEALIEAYGITEDNLIAPSPKPTKKTRTRTKVSSKDESDNQVSTNTRKRNRNKTTTTEAPRKSPSRQSTRRNKNKNKKNQEGTSTYSSLKVVTPAYTTPAPPATPDMGGAFKCEDEGFFPHPKDCKKYFWCLSGAGDSGIVAHQFTCPAGLYFNKAADSCDYTQNVLCNKKLAKTTSTTSAAESAGSTTTSTTTTKSIISSLFSTTRVPPKITAATSRTTYSQRTTEPTIVDEDDDEEYEEYDDEEKSEEDPKVIKELIDLIRKAGGIEELEKRLHGDSTSTGLDSTTPSTISKSLVARVLGQTGRNTLTKAKTYPFKNQNSRGSQTFGLSKEDSQSTKTKAERPQYSSISRTRPTTSQKEEDEEDDDDKNEDVPEKKEKANSFRNFKKNSAPEYTSIRRPKVSSTTESNDERIKLGENDTVDDEDDNEEDETDSKPTTPKYVNIRRQRPSTTESSVSTSKYKEIRRGNTGQTEGTDENSSTKYKLVRVKSTGELEDDEEISTSKYKSLRRGTTPPSSTISDENEVSVNYKTRGTTESSVTEESSSLKYKSIRRGTTTASTTISEDNEVSISSRGTTESSVKEENSSLSYKTIQRGNNNIEASTDSPSSSNPLKEIIKEFDIPGVSGLGTLSPALEISSSQSTSELESVTLPQVSSETPISDASLSTKLLPVTTNTDETSTSKDTFDSPVVNRRTPTLLEPRPFSVRGSTTKSNTESSTQSAKTSTPRPSFRIGARRRTRPTTLSTRTTTVQPTARRTTKPARRKHLKQSTKTLESQENQTIHRPRTDPRFKFISRRPSTRLLQTPKPIVSAENSDQSIESSNQQSREQAGETTELGNIAIALYDIQQAPVPSTTVKPNLSSVRYSVAPVPSSTTKKTTIKASSRQPNKIRFTTTTPVIYTTPKFLLKKKRPQAFDKIIPGDSNTFRPLSEYDYYDDNMGILGQIPEHSKVLLHSNGVIECLDQGNFPHPVSCKKFISCAKMGKNGKVLGWEYTCPKNLSFDPIGGMCNWSAGLGCHEQ